MKIAIISLDASHQTGPGEVTASLIENLYENHQISVFSHNAQGIDLSKITYYKVPTITYSKILECITFFVSCTIILVVLFLFRKRDFDIVHSNEYLCGFFADVMTSHFCERECFHLESTNSIKRERASILQKLRALDHKMYRSLRAFAERLMFGCNSSKMRIAVSARMKKEFISHYGYASEGIVVIPNGVDLEKFTPANRPLYRHMVRQRHSISDSDVLLLFAGRDWERKGLPYIIEALPLLSRSDVKLLVIGSGDKEFYSKLVKQKKISKSTIFVTDRINIWEYYAASDIFVFPTIYEPFGLVIVEAMASGLPVVTSGLAGAADFMNDGVDCLLLNDPRDINELTAKIELLLSNAKLRMTMGERARKAAEKLSWDTVAEKTLEVYNSVLRLERRAI